MQVWLHLVDLTTGDRVAQLYVQPLAGMLKQYPNINREPPPVREWHQGELVSGIYSFALPANLKPGKYALLTAMWVRPNGPGANMRLETTTAGTNGVALEILEVRQGE